MNKKGLIITIITVLCCIVGLIIGGTLAGWDILGVLTSSGAIAFYLIALLGIAIGITVYFAKKLNQ